MESLQLATSKSHARIVCDGGRLASLVVDGLELLVTEGEKPTRWGSFPMIPWCGRLRFGRLDFAGATYEFPITSPPHANHGCTHLQPWRAVDHTRTEAVIRTDLVDPWLFGGHATQRFELDETSLKVTAELTAGEVAMPAMVGWHPWFRRTLERGSPAEIRVEADAICTVDADQIPTGGLEEVPPGPWNACFVGLVADPVIDWPGALSLAISSNLDHWVIFTEPEHALCVEPQSGPPNQLNRSPRVLAPGETLTGSMTLAWSRV